MCYSLLATALLLAPPQASGLEFTNLHGGWLRGVLASSQDPYRAWVAGEGGLIRRFECAGDWPEDLTWDFEDVPNDVGANVQLEGIYLIEGGPHDGRGWAVGANRTVLRRLPAEASDEATWELVEKSAEGPMPAGSGEYLFDVAFLEAGPNLLLGWIVGADGTLWHVREEYAGGELASEEWTQEIDGNIAYVDASPSPLADRNLFSVHALIEPIGTPPGILEVGHVYVGGDWGFLLTRTST